MTAPRRIAIIGSGVSGLACAHLLDPVADVVLYEADDRLGGHANTITVEDPTAGALGVDTGFIVHNDRNYPNFVRLLAELQLETIDSEMSFAVTDRADGFCYRATNLNTLAADRRNLIDRRLWRMVIDIVRFHRHGRRFLADPDADPRLTIGELVDRGRYSNAFIDLHLIPMGAAVWSADPTTFHRFPARSLLHFLHNHGLLSIGNRPQWRTIVGGSRTYVDAIASRLQGEIRLASPVLSVDRGADGVTVATERDRVIFDEVVVATHSDQALALLADPSRAEQELLGAVSYQPNRATLHTDTNLLPPAEKAWGAWNYDRRPEPTTKAGAGPTGSAADGGPRAVLTYDLTTLQRLPGSRRYLVSLNAEHRIDPEAVIASIDYAHPVFDLAAIEAQQRLSEINGIANIWYCGAWQGHGFHEDGMSSAVDVAKSLGATW